MKDEVIWRRTFSEPTLRWLHAARVHTERGKSVGDSGGRRMLDFANRASVRFDFFLLLFLLGRLGLSRILRRIIFNLPYTTKVGSVYDYHRG